MLQPVGIDFTVCLFSTLGIDCVTRDVDRMLQPVGIDFTVCLFSTLGINCVTGDVDRHSEINTCRL
jgi:hypothetical protein